MTVRAKFTGATASSAEQRFIAKPYGRHWRVYDRKMASYPVSRPEFDSVLPTYADEGECTDVAAELDRKFRQRDAL